MVQNFHLPPVGYGPGSQPAPEDGGELEYMEMPGDMRTFEARIPMVDDTKHLEPALALLAHVADLADDVAVSGGTRTVDLATLDSENRRLIAETMGEGEVAMKIRGLPALSVQESVFAGIWNVTGAGLDRLEIGAVPADARARAFEPYRRAEEVPQAQGVVNAPALIAELLDKSAEGPAPLHVINLTLLPHTEEDLAWLEQRLGQGSTDILSRGYGNCRVRATALPQVWRVQFFNSMDTLILDTFEVTDMPEVALAAPEDISDSAERLREVIGAIQ
jgi:hydrogenase-1 operon protein HyaF